MVFKSKGDAAYSQHIITIITLLYFVNKRGGEGIYIVICPLAPVVQTAYQYVFVFYHVSGSSPHYLGENCALNDKSCKLVHIFQ